MLLALLAILLNTTSFKISNIINTYFFITEDHWAKIFFDRNLQILCNKNKRKEKCSTKILDFLGNNSK